MKTLTHNNTKSAPATPPAAEREGISLSGYLWLGTWLCLGAALLAWGLRGKSQLAVAKNAVPVQQVAFDHGASNTAAKSALPKSRNIEDIKAGDFVMARDQSDPNGALKPKRVKEVYRRVSDHLRILTLVSSDGRMQEIRTTDEHPFYTNAGWTPAGSLKEGDRVSEDGQSAMAIVAKTVYEPHPEGYAVYNFQVEDFHTYFVSAQGGRAPPVWVHNTCKIGGVDVGAYRDVKSHHIIQDAAVRDLPGYSRYDAISAALGSASNKSDPHYLTRAAQRRAGGGTYAAERRIAYRALRDAGIGVAEAKAMVREADKYFFSIGVTMSTPTRIPGDRH